MSFFDLYFLSWNSVSIKDRLVLVPCLNRKSDGIPAVGKTTVQNFTLVQSSERQKANVLCLLKVHKKNTIFSENKHWVPCKHSGFVLLLVRSLIAGD